jgi:hypothetical protein
MQPLSVKGYFNKELFLSDVRSIYSEEEHKTVDLELIKGFDS